VAGNLTDNGEVVVNSAQNGAPAILNVEGGTVSGSGDFVLNYSTTNAQLIGTLTQASTHTISGFGEINAVLTNNGVVNANVLNQTLYLLGGPMANNATFESTNGGTLAVYGVTVTQSASGTTTAGTNSVVSLNSGALITGGTLVSVGNASFQVSGTDTIGSLTSDALIEIPYEEQLNVAGNLTDNGEVVVNSGQNGAPAILDVEGGTVSGAGDFVLNYSTTNAQLNGTLTQASTHTISGFGQINANLDNFGTVNADVNNQQLQVNGTTTNNGLFEASGGGILQVASGVLTNLSGTTLTGGTYEVNASSTINLPGPVTVNAANIILNGASTSFSAITGTTAASQTNLSTNSGSFTLENGAGFSYLQGTASAPFVNTGTVSIGSGSTFSDNGKYSQSAGLSLVDGTLSTGSGVSLTGGTLSGTGTLSGGTVALSGGEIEPGAAPADGNIGTLSMAGLNISGGNLRMDIGAGGNDNIVVSGTTSYSGASTVTPVFDNYLPVAGTYNLITAASVVVNAGDAPSLVNTLPPDTRFTLVLQETSTAVNLVVGGSAASTVWVGTPGSSAWDLVTTKNWWNPSINATEQADDYFYNLDTVTFNDTATKFNVALNTNVVPLAVTVNDSAHNYTISGTGGIGGTATLSKTGTGTLTLSTTNSYTGATSVTGGELIASSPAAIPSSSALSIGSGAKVQLAANIGPATLASLAISTGAALDVTNNTVIVNYGATDPIASIVSALASGYDSGTWTGVGINSSAVASLQASQSKLIYSVGYADGADGLIAGLNPGQIEIMPTLAGDAKLQGDVVFGDFQILAQYFGKPNTSWDEGDFTYNGATNFGDFQMLAQDFGQTASGLASSEFTALNSFAAQFGDTLVANASGGGYSVVALPEPASIGLVAVSLGLLARRRRRR
jgi:fibronectin-binding autotransporter adhesin